MGELTDVEVRRAMALADQSQREKLQMAAVVNKLWIDNAMAIAAGIGADWTKTPENVANRALEISRYIVNLGGIGKIERAEPKGPTGIITE